MIGKGEHRHFMHKEIYEQPQVIGDTLNTMFNPASRTFTLPSDAAFRWRDIERVTIIACGTSYYAGMVAKYWIEQLARIPVEVDIASEFRYRASGHAEGRAGAVHLAVGRDRRHLGGAALLPEPRASTSSRWSMCRESTMARESDVVLQTVAGPEIGVASTKAFTTQLTVLACLALVLGRARGTIDHAAEARLSKRPGRSPGRRLPKYWPMTSACAKSPRTSWTPATCSIWAAAPAIPSRWKAPSSSRRSATSTPRAMPPAR